VTALPTESSECVDVWTARTGNLSLLFFTAQGPAIERAAEPLCFRMMARPTAAPLKVEHYKNLPETGPRHQLIDGDLYKRCGLGSDLKIQIQERLCCFIQERACAT